MFKGLLERLLTILSALRNPKKIHSKQNLMKHSICSRYMIVMIWGIIYVLKNLNNRYAIKTSKNLLFFFFFWCILNQ